METIETPVGAPRTRIVMQATDLNDQAGMERAFRDYFRQVAQATPRALNAMLEAELVRCDFSEQSVVLGVEIQPWMTNPGGILHGGVTASLLDLAMGVLSRYVSGGVMTPTIDLNIKYLRSATAPCRLCVSGRITKRGRTFVHAESALWRPGQEDRLLATAEGIYCVQS